MMHSSIKSTIERYKKVCANNSSSNSVTEVNSLQYYQQEAAKLRHQIQILQNANRHLMGDSLGSLTIKELKQLENRLERGIARVRTKKHELLFAEMEYIQKREMELQNENAYLKAKIQENEQAEQATIAQAETELDTLPTFDTRNFCHANMLAEIHPQNRTTLHLG